MQTGFRWLMVFCFAALALGAAEAPSKPALQRLSAQKLQEILKTKKKVFLLDVREPRELEEPGAIRGAVNIPLGQLESRLAEVPRNVPVITMCLLGQRAAKAAELLIHHGYSKPRIFAMEDWVQKGYPVDHRKAGK